VIYDRLLSLDSRMQMTQNQQSYLLIFVQFFVLCQFFSVTVQFSLQPQHITNSYKNNDTHATGHVYSQI